MKNVKKVAALLLACTLILGLCACGSSGSSSAAPKTKLDQIKEAGVLKLGTSADYPPCEYHVEIDGKDTIIGYDIDIANYIADSLGVKLEITDMAFDSLLIALQKGDFDMVIAGMSKTDERAKSADFTDPYYSEEQVILVRKEDADLYKTTDDLEGKVIGVQTGTVEVPYAIEYTGDANVVQLVKAGDVVMELQNHKIDVAYIDPNPSRAFASGNDDLVVLDIGIGVISEGQAIAIQKGNPEWLEYLDKIVDEMQEKGLIDKYIGEAVLAAGIEE